ncbi:MAG: methyltransferase domain-containing protein [Acidobacteriota bacterium]
MKHHSLQKIAARIFGNRDTESIRRWVEYWENSRVRNKELIESFQPLVAMDFTGKSILDIGCGTGGLGELVSDGCRAYVGGDFNYHVLQFAQAGPRRSYLQCSATALPFADRSFDYIFAFDVIEHLVGGKPWQVQFLLEMKRVLRPLGMIFLTTPNRFYPFEGHSRLYFHHYLSSAFSDRYLAWRNPGFLREHGSFAEIRLLTPGGFRDCLRKSRLALLHDLPCGLDREEYRRLFPLRGVLARLGAGWYPHAEFWGILTHEKQRRRLRLKLKKHWFYENNQPSPQDPGDFDSSIDFTRKSYGHQLGAGWHWYEMQGQGYRWTQQEATCYLESKTTVRRLRLRGYSPRKNRLDVRVDGLRVGERPLDSGEPFELEYLIPFSETFQHLFEVRIHCQQVFHPGNARDERELGVMISSIELF